MRFRNIYRLVGNLFERLVGNIFDETKVGIVLLCWAGPTSFSNIRIRIQSEEKIDTNPSDPDPSHWCSTSEKFTKLSCIVCQQANWMILADQLHPWDNKFFILLLLLIRNVKCVIIATSLAATAHCVEPSTAFRQTEATALPKVTVAWGFPGPVQC